MGPHQVVPRNFLFLHVAVVVGSYYWGVGRLCLFSWSYLEVGDTVNQRCLLSAVQSGTRCTRITHTCWESGYEIVQCLMCTPNYSFLRCCALPW